MKNYNKKIFKCFKKVIRGLSKIKFGTCNLYSIEKKGYKKRLETSEKVEKIFKKVPPWNIYYPSLSEATLEQKRFYNYWLKNFEKGKFIDINGNLSYIFVYLYSVIERFINDKDINHLSSIFEKLNRGYCIYEKIKDYLTIWLADAYLYINNYDKAWEVLKKEGVKLRLDYFFNLKLMCKDKSIDGQDLLRINGRRNGITRLGREHLKEEIINLTTIFLKDFEKKYGKNIVEYYCLKFDFSNLTEGDFIELENFYPNEKDFLLRKKKYKEREKKKFPSKYGHYLFRGAPISKPFIEFEAIPYIIWVAIKNEAKRILRECENTIREEENIPRVGECWVSETELFYKTLKAFPNEKIVHHGRPTWLSQQHLDIYFPLKNIGIEYQGEQHQKPVEYFGGKKALEKRQKLDRRKKRLCEKHGCKLLYVYEGYYFENVRQQIEDILVDCLF